MLPRLGAHGRTDAHGDAVRIGAHVEQTCLKTLIDLLGLRWSDGHILFQPYNRWFWRWFAKLEELPTKTSVKVDHFGAQAVSKKADSTF